MDQKMRALMSRLESSISEKPKRPTEVPLQASSSSIPMLPPGVSAEPRQSAAQVAARIVEDYVSPLQELGLPKLCGDVQTSLPVNLFGMPYRVTGAESMAFLATAMRSLLKYLKERLPEEPLKAYFSSAVEQVVSLKWMIYKCNASKLFSPAHLVSEMEKVKWDMREIRTQHSAYVDMLGQEFNVLKNRFDSLGEIRVPQMAANFIWTEVLTQLNSALIDGFATASKCTNEGRAQMQLDYRQLQLKLKSYTSVRAQSELVEDFIRAFYLPDEELELWIQEHHKTYSKGQLKSLANVGNTRRTNKKKLIELVDELKGEPRRGPIPDM